MAREETSELLVERRLDHESGEAQAFYRSLQDLAGGRPLTCRGNLDFVFSRRGGASLRFFRVRVLTFSPAVYRPLVPVRLTVSPNYTIPANSFYPLHFPVSRSNDKYPGTVP